MINENKLKEIKELFKQEVKNITYEGQMTIIEFENGEILPLYGGVAGIEHTNQKILLCSFCQKESTKEKPLVSLNEENEPLICPDCATSIIKIFVENGIEIELDISNMVSEDLIEKIINQNEDLSK